jgi:hypothetical protein
MPGQRGKRKTTRKRRKEGKEAKYEREQRGNTYSNDHHLHRVRDAIVGDDARLAMVLIAME